MICVMPPLSAGTHSSCSTLQVRLRHGMESKEVRVSGAGSCGAQRPYARASLILAELMCSVRRAQAVQTAGTVQARNDKPVAQPASPVRVDVPGQHQIHLVLVEQVLKSLPARRSTGGATQVGMHTHTVSCRSAKCPSLPLQAAKPAHPPHRRWSPTMRFDL